MITIQTGHLPELPPAPPAGDPRLLDRIADALLQHGYRRQAEFLAHRAQLLREAGQ